MDLVKFSDYDLFGYFAAGLATLGIFYEITKTSLVLGATWDVEHSAIVIVAAYVMGHIIASAATLLLDRLLVRQVIGLPSEILFDDPVAKGKFNWKAWVLSGFLEPLPESVKAAALSRAAITTYAKGDGEVVFWKDWPVIKREPLPYARMDAFLRLYGFCRNISLTAFLAAIAFLFKEPNIPGMNAFVWAPATIMLAISIAMFHRYLKFFRLYSVEVISTYAEPATPKNTT